MLISNTFSASTSDRNQCYTLDHSWSWCAQPVSCNRQPAQLIALQEPQDSCNPDRPPTSNKAGQGNEPLPKSQKQQKKKDQTKIQERHKPAHPEKCFPTSTDDMPLSNAPEPPNYSLGTALRQHTCPGVVAWIG